MLGWPWLARAVEWIWKGGLILETWTGVSEERGIELWVLWRLVWVGGGRSALMRL